MVNPPSPHIVIVWRPGYANCAPNALGAALAMEAHENEPKSLRFLLPVTCLAIQMQAVPVSRERQCKFAKPRGLVLIEGIALAREISQRENKKCRK